MWLKRLFVISEIEFNCCFFSPNVPFSFVLVAEIFNASNNIFPTFAFADPFGTGGALLDMPVLFWLGHRGLVAIRLMISGEWYIENIAAVW